ncbi:hypothetical protein ABZX40_22330 [Streptomyces sp. NPDC004610]|uniref:hypothetical protein n=1 Tax=unclassified Streptomyces TaxID=2593676 RepID=UPI0033B37836
MSADEPILTRSSFRRLHPLSAPHPLSLPPARIWSDADWQIIRRGYQARDMDEKWNVFTEGDEVFLHRSWTGNGVFVATFTPAEGGGRRITRALVERDPARQRSTDDDHDRLMLELVLSAIVLGEPATELRAALVEARDTQGATDAAAIQHSLLGLRTPSGQAPA